MTATSAPSLGSATPPLRTCLSAASHPSSHRKTAAPLSSSAPSRSPVGSPSARQRKTEALVRGPWSTNASRLYQQTGKACSQLATRLFIRCYSNSPHDPDPTSLAQYSDPPSRCKFVKRPDSRRGQVPMNAYLAFHWQILLIPA